MGQKTRLYLKQPMVIGQEIILQSAEVHYLFSVMRLREGDMIATFNGKDGEFLARIEHLSKRAGCVRLEEKTRPLMGLDDLWLIFAPIKKERTDFIVEKATELGVERILPVCTAYSNTRRINHARLEAHIIEAAEQCGATALPQLDEMRPLRGALQEVAPARHLIFCDEALSAKPEGAPARLPIGGGAILVGPEAGFREDERKMLLDYPNLVHCGLGRRILRADTAAVVAITLWQQAQKAGEMAGEAVGR